jgi:oxygen-independent coproporphyrinogen-3 oxidase
MIDRVERIAAAVGGVRGVAYEAAHVYPLSAPAFVDRPGAPRAHPGPGPLKLYAHVPFCNYACGFCFYVKRVGAGRAEMERYVGALERELEWVEPGTPLAQLYVGGGTPTALPADLLGRALASILVRMPPRPGASLTVECSPESVSTEHAAVLCEHGVPRASMGIESMEPRVLDTLRRRHGPEQALAACDLLLDAGLVVNVDLIYGLPGQDEASFVRDVERVAARGVQSISVYSLRLNERTPVASAVQAIERLELPRLLHWREIVERSLGAQGFEQVRWHTFVRRGAAPSGFDRAPCGESFGPGRQLGIGVSALSHLGHTLYRNDDRVVSYMERVERGESPVRQLFELDAQDRKTLYVARTLGDGGVLDRAAYASAVGSSADEDFGATLRRLSAGGLIDDDGRRISLSAEGRLVYDLVTLTLYPERARRWLDARQPRRDAASHSAAAAPSA